MEGGRKTAIGKPEAARAGSSDEAKKYLAGGTLFLTSLNYCFNYINHTGFLYSSIANQYSYHSHNYYRSIINTTKMTTSTDPTVFLTDLLHTLQDFVVDSIQDFQDFTSMPKVRHWLRIIVVVAGYILLRPAIELFFKWLFERKNSKEEEELKKKKEEEDKQLEAEGLKKPKKDGNSLRVGAKPESEESEKSEKKEGVVKDNTKTAGGGKKAATTAANETNKKDSKTKDSKTKNEDYEDSDQEDYAEKIRASGVLEWGRDARKRKQRQQTETEQQQQQKKMDEEKLMELLDWSDGEGKQ